MEQTGEEGIQQLSALIVQDPQAQDNIVVNMDLLNSDPQADGLSVSGLGSLSIQGSVGLEVGLSGHTNHEIFRPEHNTGMLRYIVDQTLGQNRSDPIWWLRLLAAISLVAATTTGIVFLPGYLHGVHATYRRVMLVMTVGAPIVVAVFTLLLSFCLASDPDGRNLNWITGLSVVNLSMLGGPLVVYWALQQETGN